VENCTEAEGDGDADPVARGGDLLLVVCPQPVTTNNVEVTHKTPSHFQGDIVVED
jgi:hypothetical protein